MSKYYNVFHRTHWVAFRRRKEGRKPLEGEKTYLRKRLSYAEALEVAKQYNDTHYPGFLERKAEIELTMDDAKNVSHPGSCYADVVELQEIPRIARQLEKINPETLRDELREYGFEPESLSNHEDNLSRILWLAGGDIRDNNPEEGK